MGEGFYMKNCFVFSRFIKKHKLYNCWSYYAFFSKKMKLIIFPPIFSLFSLWYLFRFAFLWIKRRFMKLYTKFCGMTFRFIFLSGLLNEKRFWIWIFLYRVAYIVSFSILKRSICEFFEKKIVFCMLNVL